MLQTIPKGTTLYINIIYINMSWVEKSKYVSICPRPRMLYRTILYVSYLLLYYEYEYIEKLYRILNYLCLDTFKNIQRIHEVIYNTSLRHISEFEWLSISKKWISRVKSYTFSCVDEIRFKSI